MEGRGAGEYRVAQSRAANDALETTLSRQQRLAGLLDAEFKSARQGCSCCNGLEREGVAADAGPSGAVYANGCLAAYVAGAAHVCAVRQVCGALWMLVGGVHGGQGGGGRKAGSDRTGSSQRTCGPGHGGRAMCTDHTQWVRG